MLRGLGMLGTTGAACVKRGRASPASVRGVQHSSSVLVVFLVLVFLVFLVVYSSSVLVPGAAPGAPAVFIKTAPVSTPVSSEDVRPGTRLFTGEISRDLRRDQVKI